MNEVDRGEHKCCQAGLSDDMTKAVCENHRCYALLVEEGHSVAVKMLYVVCGGGA